MSEDDAPDGYERVGFTVEDGEDAERIRTGRLSDVSIGFEGSDEESRMPFLDEGREAAKRALSPSFSVEFSIGGESVTCPCCGSENVVPESPLLEMLTDGPVPCRVCGYPLL